MKKIILIIVIMLLIGLGAVLSKDENKQALVNKNVEQTKTTPQPELFTKEKALKRIQNYEIQTDLKSPTIAKGTTLLNAYETRGKIPAIKNLGWNVADIGPGKFIVSFKQEINTIINEPKWEVDKDNIKAINGEALNYTPELGASQKDTGGTEFEKQVYDTFSSLYKEYSDTEELEQAEQKALSETATKYQITIEQVREIFTRLDKEKYSQ